MQGKPAKPTGPAPTRFTAQPADFEAAAKRVLGAGRPPVKRKPAPKKPKG